MENNYFIFVDESGTNKQDQFFGLGCLLIPTEYIGLYHQILLPYFDRLKTTVSQNEKHLLSTLQGEDLVNFLKGRQGKGYEAKFKHINQLTYEGFRRIVSAYFLCEKARFCCLIIDKNQDIPPAGMSYYDIYKQRLSLLLRNNVADASFVILPDEVTAPGESNFEKEIMDNLNQKYNKKCFGAHRMQSDSSIYLQLVDILTGGVMYDFKNTEHQYKTQVTQKIKDKLQVTSLAQSFTKNTPNYFSVWRKT